MLAEGVCEVPRRAEGARRSANWIPSMVVVVVLVRRGGLVAYGGGMALAVSLCRRLDRDEAYGMVWFTRPRRGGRCCGVCQRQWLAIVV